jgi:phosphoglycolate phosphatase-like HAD superfamily hydrolase
MWSAESGLLALDLDGTLIDARRRQLSVLAKVLAERDLPLVPFDWLWERKRGGETTVEALIALEVDDAEARAVAARWVERVEDEDELLQDKLLPGVEDTLTALAAAGVRPLVLTARASGDRTRHQFTALGLDRWCNGPEVVDSTEPTTQKATALQHLGAAAYVGDTESDARAASLAGIPFAAVATGQRSPSFLAAQGLTPHASLAAALLAAGPGRFSLEQGN